MTVAPDWVSSTTYFDVSQTHVIDVASHLWTGLETPYEQALQRLKEHPEDPEAVLQALKGEDPNVLEVRRQMQELTEELTEYPYYADLVGVPKPGTP